MIPKDVLRVATYNIRTATPEDVNDLWETRKDNVMKVVLDYDFDIVGFQEVREVQLQDLRTLKGYEGFGEGRSKDESNEYNPIFYKKDKFDLLDSGTFWLSETLKYEEKPRRWDSACSRICTWGLFRVKESKEEFYLFNTHFDHESEEARYQSAKLLLSQFAKLEKNRPIILMGDLNGEKEERFYQLLSSKLTDAIATSKHHVGPYVTCTGVSFNHQLSWEKYQSIDYILLSEGIDINKTIVITDRFDRKFPSDHFPLCSEITF